jgi:hypothetical protein
MLSTSSRRHGCIDMDGMGEFLMKALLMICLVFSLARKMGSWAFCLLLVAPIALFGFRIWFGMPVKDLWDETVPFWLLLLSLPILLCVALGVRKFNMIKSVSKDVEYIKPKARVY